MVKFSGLAPIITNILGLPEPTAETVARSLRPAGLLNSKGRGLGGASMTSWDLSNMLLGMTCSEQFKEAGEVVPFYRYLFGQTKRHMLAPEQREPVVDGNGLVRVLPPESLCPEPMQWLADTAQGQTLGDALDRLFDMAHEGTLQTLFRQLASRHVGGEGADREARFDRAIELGMIYLRIEFSRPRPRVVITFGDDLMPPFLQVEFGAQGAMETSEQLDRRQIGDRVVTVTVTHKTIFALGEALRR